MWHSRAGAGALVIRDASVLMVLRERAGVVRWELPSGLLEAGESFEQAAARETFEETGIQVAVGDLLCTVVMVVPQEAYRGINAYFYATAQSGEPPRVVTPTEPIKRAAFLELADLTSEEIHPVDQRILSRWRRRARTHAFHLFLTL
jgi:ADP-ribose pyrophosphatase YjhB (NUDIX family)